MMRPEPRNTLLVAVLAVWLTACAMLAPSAAAQDANASSPMPASHADRVAEVIVTCLAPVVSTDGAAYRLVWGGGYPFLETRLAARLLDAGVELGGGDKPALRVDLERADIAFRRAGGRTLERTVQAGIGYALTQPDGALVAADVCAGSLTDRMDRRTAEALSDPQSDLTRPALPRTGLWSRFVEPAVLVGATAIGTWLFFNLRSKRADGG
jgi:hypothetical protein